jgi:hypothetical protein
LRQDFFGKDKKNIVGDKKNILGQGRRRQHDTPPSEPPPPPPKTARGLQFWEFCPPSLAYGELFRRSGGLRGGGQGGGDSDDMEHLVEKAWPCGGLGGRGGDQETVVEPVVISVRGKSCIFDKRLCRDVTDAHAKKASRFVLMCC